MEERVEKQTRTKSFPSGVSLEIVQGDITQMETDVIVNAANKHLAHGGGVAAAIVNRGGAVIQEESYKWVRKNGLISADQPAFTTGGSMHCKYVIHTVGPIWGEGEEDKKLAVAIRSSLHMANSLKARSVSFPAISTGIYGFPIGKAADIFMKVISAFAAEKDSQSVKRILLVLYDLTSFEIFKRSFDKNFTDNQES